tara:strand:- start:906 stop:2150 length:1245 start_codon:yes stop_codon:yes gene_type:complete
MTGRDGFIGPKGIYRGWWIAGGCFVMAFFAWGTGFYGHGFYIVALGKSTAWSVSVLSSAVAGFWLGNVVASLLMGGVMDRWGTRPAIAYGALAMGGGCVGIGAIDAGALTMQWQLFAVFIVMGSGYPGLAAMAISASLVPWFKKRLGLALGIGLTGASAGGAVLPPLLAYLTESYGFGISIASVGLILILCIFPIAGILVRNPRTDEAQREFPAETSAARTVRRSYGSFLSDLKFWLITLASALSLGAQVGLLMHQIPLLQGGLGLAGASAAVSVAALSAVGGRIVLGMLSGRYPLADLAAGCYLLQAFALGLLIVGEGPTLFYAASALAGFVVGCITMLPPMLLVDSYGANGYATAYSMTAAVMFISGSAATALSGALFDWTGSYGWSLVVLIGMHLVASTLILWHGRRLRLR